MQIAWDLAELKIQKLQSEKVSVVADGMRWMKENQANQKEKVEMTAMIGEMKQLEKEALDMEVTMGALCSITTNTQQPSERISSSLDERIMLTQYTESRIGYFRRKEIEKKKKQADARKAREEFKHLNTLTIDRTRLLSPSRHRPCIRT